MLKINK